MKGTGGLKSCYLHQTKESEIKTPKCEKCFGNLLLNLHIFVSNNWIHIKHPQVSNAIACLLHTMALFYVWPWAAWACIARHSIYWEKNWFPDLRQQGFLPEYGYSSHMTLCLVSFGFLFDENNNNSNKSLFYGTMPGNSSKHFTAAVCYPLHTYRHTQNHIYSCYNL